MTKETTIFILGFAVLFVPVLGIPNEWKQYVLFGIGALLLWLGYALRRKAFLQQIDRGNGERETDSFVESTQNLFEQDEVS